jgi:hypothetical protein
LKPVKPEDVVNLSPERMRVAKIFKAHVDSLFYDSNLVLNLYTTIKNIAEH